MTHYESIDPDKVKEIFAKFFAIDKRTGEIRTCSGLGCVDCLFHSVNSCRVGKMKWLDRPAIDWDKDIDWKKVPVNTPVLVNLNTDEEVRRYFFARKTMTNLLLIGRLLMEKHHGLLAKKNMLIGLTVSYTVRRM